jgi:hypothetical protein
MFGELERLEAAQRERVFATMLAIALLRARCGGQRSSWMLIEAKGLDWLSSFGVRVDELVARAIALISD